MTHIFHHLVSAFIIASPVSEHSLHTPCSKLTDFIQFLKHHGIFPSDLHILFPPTQNTEHNLPSPPAARLTFIPPLDLSLHTALSSVLLWPGTGDGSPLLYAPTIPFPSVSNTHHAFLCLIIYTCLTLHHHPSAPLPYTHTHTRARMHAHTIITGFYLCY